MDELRLWEDGEKRLYTDDQLLRHVAHFGSLEAACRRGNIRLVSESESRIGVGRASRRVRLADYLEEG